MSELLKTYLHYVVMGLAAFTIIGIVTLCVGVYRHERALSETKAESAALMQKQQDAAAAIKSLREGMEEHDKAIDLIIHCKALTPTQVRDFFQTYEAVRP